MAKPLTKALHTTRIVGAIARHIVAKHNGSQLMPSQLYVAVLGMIDNAISNDSILNDACVAECKAALGRG